VILYLRGLGVNQELPYVYAILTHVMEPSEGVVKFKPEIVENYKDFEPPERFRTLVDQLLLAVPSHYLVGLKTIMLTNQSALTRDQRRQKIWGRRRKYRLAEVRGAYYEATRSRPASVLLLVDNVVKGLPPWVLRTPLICYGEISEVLYHEIGHHIHAVHHPVYDGKENVAEDWYRKLQRRFVRKHYWYMIPVLYPLWLLTKALLKLALWAKALRSPKA
jgi:hypothetical protein